MASGLCAALTGRTHGCTDQPANVKKTLANSEPSTHGPKQTWASAPHMSAFGGKADMSLCRNPLSGSLLGAKRTCPFALHMSANPKRTYVRSDRAGPNGKLVPKY
jgi:hypothetical protein